MVDGCEMALYGIYLVAVVNAGFRKTFRLFTSKSLNLGTFICSCVFLGYRKIEPLMTRVILLNKLFTL